MEKLATELKTYTTTASTMEKVQLFTLIYDGELDEYALKRAVENQSIPQKSKSKWHCSGIRKLLTGNLDLANNTDLEKATAISRRIARFMAERPESFDSLAEATREELLRFHRSTGARDWIDEREQLLAAKIEANAELLVSFGMSFKKTPPSELNQNLTSSGLVHFSWIECGHEETRSASSINISINGAGTKVPSCKECRRLDNSLIVWYYSKEDFLLGSGVDISRVSEEDRLQSAYSKTKFEVGYGCGHWEMTTFQSLKDKEKRAHDFGQETISCNNCKVPDGTFEVGIRMAVQLVATLVPGVTIEKQFELEGLENKNYDMLIRLSSGKLYLIEVDGGLHYKPFNKHGEDDFARKVEVDREKTQVPLERGIGLIRIDERNHRGEINDELAAILTGAMRGTLPLYTVVGEECPGAKLVSNELKGWA